MLNTSDTSARADSGGGGVRLQEVMGHVTGNGGGGGDSSSPALTAVIVCMTIMAVCAVFYFAIRYYFEERRWRAGAVLCKCLPPGTVATLSTIECANACRYNEKRAATVGVQTVESMCWPNNDVRTSDARLTGRKYASPLNNNEAIPHWRPPATGSSQRHAANGSNSSGGIGGIGGIGGGASQTYRTSQKKQRYFVHHSTQYPSEHSYPLRRSRNISMMPSILVQSASSSDSYSHLTSSHLSKQAPPIKDKVHLLNYSGSDGDDDEMDCRMLRAHLSRQHDGSGLTDPLAYGTSPYHPRNNTPVSELMGNEDDIELAAVVVNVEQCRDDSSAGAAAAREESSTSGPTMADEAGYEEDASSDADSGDRNKSGLATASCSQMPTTADGATQICQAIDYTVPLKLSSLQQQQHQALLASCCSVDGSARSAGSAPSLDTMRLASSSRSAALPPKSAFPSFELLPGGRLVTRWTQTDNASVMSLDWDHFDGVEVGVDAAAAGADSGPDELRVASTACADSSERLTSLDGDDNGAMSSATLLMVSHTSPDTSHPLRHSNSTTTHRSAASSSPYVLCYMCSEGYGLSYDDRRRTSVTNVNGVTTINIGQDFESRRLSTPIGARRPPSAPPATSSLGPTPPERQRRSQSRTAPRPSRT